MVSFEDVPIQELNEALAEELKSFSELTPPEWAYYVKTGVHKERPPIKKDWWYIRAAAMLRTIAIRGPIGVNKIKAKYGGKKDRGVRPGKTATGSGSIARKIFQQLQIVNLVELSKRSVHKGRVLAPEGLALLNKVAKAIYKPAEKPVVKAKKAPKAEKKPVAEKTAKAETPAVPKAEKPVAVKKAPEAPKTEEKPSAPDKTEKVEPKVEEKAPIETEKVEEKAEVEETPKTEKPTAPVEAPKEAEVEKTEANE